MITLFACNNSGIRYVIQNMNGDDVNVTNLITSGQFLPDSCEGRFEKLIKLKPKVLDDQDETRLQYELSQWIKEYNNWLFNYGREQIDLKLKNIYKITSYQYSYIIKDDYVDVYRTDTNWEINGIKEFKLFIRFDKKGKIMTGFKDGGWVINNCDSINSVIQNIYSKRNK